MEPEIDGIDLLLGRQDSSPREVFFYYHYDQLRAVRENRWKLHFERSESGSALYNLDNDVGETNDLKEDHPEIVARLEELATQCRLDLGDTTPPMYRGRNCRPVGRVENPEMLLPLSEADPTVQSAYD